MRSTKYGALLAKRSLLAFLLTVAAAALTTAIACGGGETVIQTVEVEKIVEVEKSVVQTVEVEKIVEVAGETVVEVVEVERLVEVAGETVVEVVEVERLVEVAGETVVEVVEVERLVQVAGETVVQVIEVEKEVEKIVEKEVEKIVEKSVVQTVVVEKIVEVMVIPTPEPVRVDSPHITNDPAENEWPTIYDENGKLFSKPDSYQEAPLLAARVAAGELPPVEERLPENPMVLKPTSGIGKYGGTWFRGFTGPADGQNMERPLHDHFLFYDVSGSTVQPNVAEKWTVNDDSTEFTFTLRKGHRWSDGAPLTTDDIMFWYEKIQGNDELVPTKPAWMNPGGELLQFEKVDDQTFKVTSAEPYGFFVTLMASVVVNGQATSGERGGGLIAPKHYLSQFHPDFLDGGVEEANAIAEEAGFENWYTYFLQRNNTNQNVDAPMLTAWRLTGSITTNEWSFERNPYYFAVDTAGNQLPYIDNVVLSLAQNNEVLNLSAIAGNYTVMGRHINLAKLPLFLQNAESVGYRVQFWRQPQSGIANLYINETWDGNAEIQSFLQNIEFRRALSMGIERDQINEVFFLGIGQTSGLCQGYADPDNPGKYIGEDDVQFNADAANAILDEIGLDQKDGDGFRLMPSGEKLTIQMPAVVAAFEDYPGINEMIARQWAVNIGVHGEVQSLERTLESNRRTLNELMLFNWESSPRSTTLITPTHLLPVAGGGNTGRLYGDWYQSNGESGIKPTNPYLLEQMELFDESQTTATADRAAEILQRVVTLNCLNVNPITTIMNKPTYVAIIKNNVRNIPNPLPFSYHNQTSGNGHPEQWWIDDENAMMGK